MSVLHLQSLVEKLDTAPIVNKPSPASHPRRAGVAAILRWKCNDKLLETETASNQQPSLALGDFMNRIESTPGELELLFIQRAKRAGDVWSGHVALPGGKNEEKETDLDTAMREVEEEIGLDLNGPGFLLLGKLDDKTITSVDNDFMMIMVPFVFLQLTWDTPPLTIQPSEVASVHWVGLHYLVSTPILKYDPFAASLPDAQRLLRYPQPGVVEVPSIRLPSDTTSNQGEDEPIILWGLTLRIIQQLIGFASNQSQQDATIIAYNIDNNTINGNGKSRL